MVINDSILGLLPQIFRNQHTIMQVKLSAGFVQKYLKIYKLMFKLCLLNRLKIFDRLFHWMIKAREGP